MSPENQRPTFELLNRPVTLARKTQLTQGDVEEFYSDADLRMKKLDMAFSEWLKVELAGLDKIVADLQRADDPAESLAALRDKAHELRGTCGNYKRPDLAQVCKSLYELSAASLEQAVSLNKMKALALLHAQTMNTLAFTGETATQLREAVLNEIARAVATVTGQSR